MKFGALDAGARVSGAGEAETQAPAPGSEEHERRRFAEMVLPSLLATAVHPMKAAPALDTPEATGAHTAENPQSQGVAGAPEAAAAAWRNGDDNMTVADVVRRDAHDAVSGSHGARGGAAGGADRVERVVTRMQTEHVGDVVLVVERSQRGVQVVVGFQDAGAIAAAEAQRSALAQALSANGLGSASLAIVPAKSLGTLLAQSSDVARTDADGESEPRSSGQTGVYTRRRFRRLDTTG